MYRRFLKPLLDRIGAVALLLLFSPLLAVALAAVYISLGRPLFFTQRRPGLGGRLFTIYKLRTMDARRDAEGNFLPDNQRLRGVGRVIRSLSLDELPQLYNVLRGEMSFIGPRPLLVEYLPLYNEEQKRRHDVKPGITGWAQVNGRNAISWKEKFAYDVWYTDHLSWWLDLRIALLTIKKVFIREGINAEGHVTVEKFNGSN
ncbi:MAG: sugar transferase [Campylobacterales bacterium]|nr:sugar transferase [Campylobacterales bacterium]